jgi:hypothetical protein
MPKAKAKKKKKTSHKHKSAGPIMIEIIPGTGGNPPTVSNPNQPVSKAKQERVQWWSHSKDWAVTFDPTTPFEKFYFSPCHAGNTSVTGAVGIHYKYWIYVDGEHADPVIIISN